MPDRRPMATTKELAEYLRKEPETVKRWRYLKIGPRYTRVNGGEVLYDWADVDEWMRGQEHGPEREVA